MATKTTSKTTSKAASKTDAASKAAAPKATSAGRRKSIASSTADRAKAAAVAMKSSASAAPAAGIAAATAAASAAVASAATKSVPATNEALRRPDLIQAVADRVSLKRSEAKMVFDVVLDEIGKALDANEEVIVPPLGKLMVKKRLEKPGGEMLTLKLKRAEADPTAGDVGPLAKAAERG